MRGSVFKIKTGKNKDKWKGVVYIGKNPNTGKWIRKEVYGDGEKDVQIKVNDLVYEIQNNIYADPGPVSVEKYLNEWLEIYKDKVEENTAEYYKDMLNKHIIPNLGKIKLRELKPMDIDNFYNYLMRDPKAEEKRKKLSGNSVLKIHSIIHNALQYAVFNNKIKSNPADYVKPPKKEKFVPEIMTEADFRRLLSYVKGTFDEIPILLAACTGLRRSEIFGLQWRDIDFSSNVLKIRRSTTRYRTNITKNRTKNESSKRFIAVPSFVVTVLKAYCDNLKVVPEFVCSKYKAQSYSHHFDLLLKKCGLNPDYRLHDLRHFNAVIMLIYGVPDKVASKRLGHAQVSTTQEIYQHVITDMDKEAAEILDNFFYKKPDESTSDNTVSNVCVKNVPI